MTEIYIVRHGESEGNRSRIFQGTLDMSLTGRGYSQAKSLKEYFSDITLDCVYSSDLSRAEKTALCIGNRVITDKRLREIDAGVWQGKTVDYIKARYPEKWHQWTTDRDNFSAVGGESIKDTKKRMTDFFTEAGEKHNGGAIAVITHGAVLKAFLAEISKKPIDEVALPGNCSVSQIIYDNGEFSIAFTDDTHHLSLDESRSKTDFA